MKFSQITKTKPRVISLPEGYFREDYQVPLPGTRIGIRRLSIGEMESAHEDAQTYQEDGIKSFNRALMLNIVSRALVHPEDITKTYLKAGDLEARAAFTPEGLTYLYDIVLQMHLSTTPIYEEITDPQIELLFTLLKSKKLPGKIKRLLSYVLDCVAEEDLCLPLYPLLLRYVLSVSKRNLITTIFGLILIKKTLNKKNVRNVEVDINQNPRKLEDGAVGSITTLEKIFYWEKISLFLKPKC